MHERLKPRRLFEEPECVETFYSLAEAMAHVRSRIGQPRPEFKPRVRYNRTGDFFEIVWEDVLLYYVEALGDFEVCREMETKRIIGVKLWGAKKRMGLIQIKDNE